MKALAGGGVAAGLLLFATVATSQTSPGQTSPATPSQPRLSNVHSRGVQVLMAGQAAAADASAPPQGPPPSRPVFVVAPVTHSVVKPCERPLGHADLTLGEKGFDRSLSGALKTGGAVVVDVAQPYDPAADPPSSLSPWLAEAKAGGGAVTVSPYCTAGRGIVHDWVEDVVARLSGRIYRPARNYDIVLYADAAKRRVTQVQFKPRPPVTASN